MEIFLIILGCTALFGLSIWGVKNTMKVLKEDQDDFENGRHLIDKAEDGNN